MKGSKSPAPWSEGLGRDLADALERLETRQWDPDFALSLFEGPLSDVISSLEFSSQHRWGLQANAEEIRHLSHAFLVWMNSARRWEDWRVAIKEFSGTWPLRFLLAREYLRFASERPVLQKSPGHRQQKFVAGGAMNPNRLSELGDVLSREVLDAFSHFTQKLPLSSRLPYELHLEGLLNHEISWLLSLGEAEVEKKIADAKEFLLDLTSEGDRHREGT